MSSVPLNIVQVHGCWSEGQEVEVQNWPWMSWAINSGGNDLADRIGTTMETSMCVSEPYKGLLIIYCVGWNGG